MRHQPVLWVTLFGVTLVAGIFVVTTMAAGEFRERSLANRERELENTVRLLTSQFDRQFEDADTVAHRLIDSLNLADIPSSALFREQMSGPKVGEMLRRRISAVSYLGDFAIVGADGDLINWSRAEPPPPKINVSSRSYFQTLKSGPQSAPALVESVYNPALGTWIIVSAHRLTGSKGVFLGVLMRWIDARSYERYFAAAALADGTAISLFDREGRRLARYPYVEEQAEKNFKGAPLMRKVLAEDGRQALPATGALDSQEQLGAAASLAHSPLLIIATTTTAASAAEWRKQVEYIIWAAILSAVAIAAILYHIRRQHRKAQRRVESEWQRLGAALDNMSQGLKLYDASGHLITCNRRYIEMFGLSPDIVKPGAHFREVMQHRKDKKTFDGDVDEFCTKVMQGVADGIITKKVMEFSDGRAIRIVNTPLAQGGWIATMEDVSERRDLEQERDRNYTFLREIIDHIPWLITVKDVCTRQYLLANRVAEDQFGQSRETIVGKTAFDILPKPVAERVTREDDRLLRSPDGLFLDAHAWHKGPSYVTSRRIGINDRGGEPRYIINVIEDVTERRRADEKIAHMAHYDALTDLPNRVLFREHIERELKKVDQGEKFAILYIDIDEFKSINDSLGHHVGDELLKAIANRIRTCLKRDDLVARLGGDEFAVIRTGIDDSTDVLAFVNLIHEAIRRPYHCFGHQLSTDASIGIALAPQDGTNLDQLLKNADLAMYAAKADGRRVHRFFVPAMDANAKARLAMEQDLRRAMIDGDFELHYQPIVDLRTNGVSGCEALLRWRHPEHGIMSSAEFVPVAEDTGLIVELGDWTLRTACMEAATWPAHVRLAVNVSPVQLKCETFALKVAGVLAVSGLDPRRLELEITEAVLIRDDEAALAILHQLRSLGVRIALDDFGTGYSSLSYLKRFPFDKIKIDRCFVADVAEASGAQAIVQAVVNIASASNMTTVAEGVETEEQLAMLRSLGCTEMQGYLFSAPKSATEVKTLFGMSAQEAAAS